MTSELDESAVYHQKRLLKAESTSNDLSEELEKAWMAHRELSQNLRDKTYEYDALTKESTEELASMRSQLSQHSKLLIEKNAKIEEMAEAHDHQDEMIEALSNHVTGMLMERDEALDRLKQFEGGLTAGSRKAAVRVL